MVGRFRVLGVDLRLEGPDDVVAAISVAYKRFKIPANEGEGASLRVVPPAGSPDAEMLLYQRFLATLLSQVERHAVFHGAALVDRRGGGLLLAGPSGHGKSSLTLELVHRGFRFMGDDYAPVDLGLRTVWPFPRTASVLPRGSAPLPSAVRALAGRADGPRLFGKALVDVGEAFGDSAVATGPVPVRTVVVLTSGTGTQDGRDVSWMTVAVRAPDAERIGRGLRSIPGVVIEHEGQGRGLHRWHLRVEHAQGPTDALSAVIEDEAVLYSERTWSGVPDFDQAPSAAPLKHREAAVLLTRELLNRRRGSRFLAGRQDGVVGLVLEVSSALRDTRCFEVRVGRFHETVEMVERLTERSDP